MAMTSEMVCRITANYQLWMNGKTRRAELGWGGRKTRRRLVTECHQSVSRSSRVAVAASAIAGAE